MTRILHILNDGPDRLSSEIIGLIDDEVTSQVIDLSADDNSYDEIIDRIADCDKVISW